MQQLYRLPIMEEELRQVNEDEVWSERDNVSCQALDAFGD